MDSVVLIGMPGAGKSTLGILLAKELACDFVDTDVLIQVKEGRTLQSVLDSAGYMALRAIEEQVLMSIDHSRHVIATGGSAVYSDAGMNHLRQLGRVVFLQASLPHLKQRIHNYETRGIARRPDQSFEALFEEREKLYRQYADITIDCNDKDPQEIVQILLDSLSTAKEPASD